MEPSKYYESGNDGIYNVHFPNKPGYSVDEITEIFSEFGNVVGVTKAGDDYGFRFVRFRTEEEVLRCVEGLKNHPTVKLLPKRQRFGNDQNSGYRKNSTNKHESREPKSTWAAWDQQKTGDCGSYNQNNSQRNEQRDFNHHRTNESIATERNVDNLNANQILRTNNNGDEHKEVARNLQEVRRVYNETFQPAASPIQQEIQIRAAASVTSVCKNVSLQTVSEEAECQRETTLQAKLQLLPIDDEMPKLVQRQHKPEIVMETKNPQAGVIPKVVEAQPVIVGNVHIDYGIHYILHMFEKYDPICVTPMKIIPNHGLRYCIAYFQSLRQALDIENEFDDYLLNGQKLMVLREHRLLELYCDV